MNFDLSDDQQDIKRTAREFLAARYKPEEVRRLASRTSAGSPTRSGTRSPSSAGRGWPWPGRRRLGMVELAVRRRGARLRARADAAAVDRGRRRSCSTRPARRERLGGGADAGADEDTAARPTVVARRRARRREGRGARRGGRRRDRSCGGRLAVVVDARRRDRSRGDARPDAAARRGDARRRRRPRAARRLRAAPARDRGRCSPPSRSASPARVEMAVAYAKERHPVRRPIGSYQAVSHACAQMLLEVEGARSAVLYAAWALDHEPETAPSRPPWPRPTRPTAARRDRSRRSRSTAASASPGSTTSTSSSSARRRTPTPTATRAGTATSSPRRCSTRTLQEAASPRACFDVADGAPAAVDARERRRRVDEHARRRAAARVHQPKRPSSAGPAMSERIAFGACHAHPRQPEEGRRAEHRRLLIAAMIFCWRRARVRSFSLRRAVVLARAREASASLPSRWFLPPWSAQRVAAVAVAAVDAADHAAAGVVDAAERVDEVGEVLEVDLDEVVDLDAEVLLDRADRQRRPADRVGGVDLVAAVAGDVDQRVARDRQARGLPAAERISMIVSERLGRIVDARLRRSFVRASEPSTRIVVGEVSV